MTSVFKVLVAGRNGQVARALQDRYDSETFELHACGRDTMDITSKSSVQSVFDRIAPDIIINAAAYTAVDQAEEEAEQAHAVNALGAGYLAQASSERSIPILHLSTDYVFDGTKATAYVESDPVAPLGVYGASKLAGEQAVARANTNHLILRTAWVYSPYGKNFVKTMLRLAASRDELGVVADQIGNPTSALDIADGLLSIAGQICTDPTRLKTGIYHMSGKNEASWADFARAIFAESARLGSPSAIVNSITSEEYPTPVKRPENSRLNCTKLEHDYGIRLQDWQSSVKNCVRSLVD